MQISSPTDEWASPLTKVTATFQKVISPTAIRSACVFTSDRRFVINANMETINAQLIYRESSPFGDGSRPYRWRRP